MNFSEADFVGKRIALKQGEHVKLCAAENPTGDNTRSDNLGDLTLEIARTE